LEKPPSLPEEMLKFESKYIPPPWIDPNTYDYIDPPPTNVVTPSQPVLLCNTKTTTSIDDKMEVMKSIRHNKTSEHIGSKVSPIYIEVPKPTPIIRCHAHPNCDHTYACHMCLESGKVVCDECFQDQQLLVMMGILQQGLGTLCSDCQASHSLSCAKHGDAAIGLCGGMTCKEFICKTCVTEQENDLDCELHCETFCYSCMKNGDNENNICCELFNEKVSSSPNTKHPKTRHRNTKNNTNHSVNNVNRSTSNCFPCKEPSPSKYGEPTSKRIGCKEPSPSKRRPRLIDLCLQKANEDVNNGVSCYSDSEDSTDLFLKDVRSELGKDPHEICHIPEFYFPLMSSNISAEDKYKQLMDSDFLTDTLIEEIESLYPEVQDTETNSGLFTNQRSKDTFKTNCELLFPIGRIFLNYKQLLQVVQMFGKAWHFMPCIQSKTIRCHYSDTTCKGSKHENLAKRRKTGISMKQ